MSEFGVAVVSLCQFLILVGNPQLQRRHIDSARRLQITLRAVGCVMVHSERPEGTALAADGLPTGRGQREREGTSFIFIHCVMKS